MQVVSYTQFYREDDGEEMKAFIHSTVDSIQPQLIDMVLNMEDLFTTMRKMIAGKEEQ